MRYRPFVRFIPARGGAGARILSLNVCRIYDPLISIRRLDILLSALGAQRLGLSARLG